MTQKGSPSYFPPRSVVRHNRKGRLVDAAMGLQSLDYVTREHAPFAEKGFDVFPWRGNCEGSVKSAIVAEIWVSKLN